mmetsp:Transcript_131600/g.281394  ORF Transcript_131600/g.281394 Transcript_131600/m.281394 type:complete len:595 (+) Transcript_131600:79-1863(+)
MAAFIITLAFCLFANLPIMAGANAFRGSSNFLAATDSMKVEDLRAIMLDELMTALGSGNKVTEERLSRLEEAVRPTFLSMPKNEYGNLEHPAVRYVLHRLFVQRHGIYLKGLEPGSDSWKGINSASSIEILEDRVPTFVQDLFEERLSGRGLGMHEIAILAATLEHLIHDEAEGRLRVAYQIRGLSMDVGLDVPQAEDLLSVYMYLFLKGGRVMYSKEAFEQMDKVYPNWHLTVDFMSQVRKEVTAANSADSAFAEGKLSFKATSKVVEEVTERYGKFQNSECVDLKAALMKIEDKSTGRVLLKDFYGGALDGAWQFTESVEYLRELGDLDETNPTRPSVLIANYVNSASNCLASSGLYSVCCVNECEELLGHVEREISGPEATPERLAEIIERLPSATVTAPRSLPETLRKRLQDIADHHGGQVQLHGRLFGQWMHHAYPRECPYPHKSNTTNPMTASDWMESKSENAQESKGAMKAVIDQIKAKEEDDDRAAPEEGLATSAASAAPKEEEHMALWSDEEELIVVRPDRTPIKVASVTWASLARQVAQVTAVIALVLYLKGHLLAGLAALKGGRDERKGGLPLAISGGKDHFC